VAAVAIRAAGLSKEYRLGERDAAPMLREAVSKLAASTVRRRSTPRREGPETFWALQDVGFEVAPGEVVGVIGRNGAGKSTLLKVLSGITEPTRGFADIYGRVGSLLEVGTGFHAELTGRENVYLNGAILGMSKREIDRRFDEIVAFSEVERYLDTPVKRYSSGMYMRLAFAVAAHLEPEILIVDEVLAVGDIAFQRKCLGRMGEVATAGRTVILVSHNTSTVQGLCDRVIWLDQGRIRAEGPSVGVIQGFIEDTSSDATVAIGERKRQGDGAVRLVSLTIEDADMGPYITSASRLRIRAAYRSDRPAQNPRVYVEMHDAGGVGIYAFDSAVTGGIPDLLPPEGTLCCVTEPIRVTAGRCYLNVGIKVSGARADYVKQAMYLDVEADADASSFTPRREWVVCTLGHQWTLDPPAAGEATGRDTP
jgi:lipopolysaccharide transport system ATP-binding protein